MSNTFNVSKGGSYAVLLSVLSLMTILAFLTLKPRVVPSKRLQSFFSLSDVPHGADWFLAARSSLSWKTLALSFFAGQMGAWILYAPTELGATASLSWVAVLGYAAASGIPGLIICWMGPRVREIAGEKAFTATDFARKRYGRVMQVVVITLSIFYMIVFTVAELTAIANVFGTIRGLDVTSDSSQGYTNSITISVCVFTVFYTVLAGLPASITTDKIQSFVMITLMLVLLFATTCSSDNRVTKAEWNRAASWTLEGFEATVTLIIAVWAAEMFNQANWQRVWAAKDDTEMRKGFFGGFVLIFFTMLFFGILGMVALAGDYEAYANYEKFSYLSFFDLLEPLPTFFYYLVLIFITALCASTVDSLQNAMIAIFSKDVMSIARLVAGKSESEDDDKSMGKTCGKWTARLLLVAINIPCVIMSARRYDVLSLFLVADLVCATAVLPVFLGLMTDDRWGLTAPTELGSLLGCIAGVCTVLVNGKIKDFNEAVNPFDPTDVWATGPFSYFWLTNGAVCSLCGTSTMVTFIVTPISAGVFCMIFSKLDVLFRGPRARKPILRKLDKAFKEKYVAKPANGDGDGKVEIIEAAKGSTIDAEASSDALGDADEDVVV